MPKTALAAAAFGLVHSVLASRQAKQAAEHLFGQRARNGLYRPLSIARSVATTAALAASIRRLLGSGVPLFDLPVAMEPLEARALVD